MAHESGQAGLSEIHAQGIVHRDLSPDNILLREGRDGRLQAKIIDLGIAKRVAADALSVTSSGVFVGKLKYCSPEQAGALPPGQVVDGRSDLYSFGVVLYEMLTGKPPFESATPEEYLGKHLHTAPPPLDTTGLPPRAGPALAAAVGRALEKRREKRYRDAREFAAALERIAPAASEPLEGFTAATGDDSRGRAFPWLLAAGILLAAAIALTLIHRFGSSSRAAVATTATAVPSVTPMPTAGPDEVVVAPRIIEMRTPTAVGTAPPSAPPSTAPPGRERPF